MLEKSTVLCFAEDLGAAHKLAAELGTSVQEIKHRKFPDGESLVQVDACSDSIVLYRPLHRPNEKLIDLFLAFGAARNQGAEQIVLVAPYLPYMRQDVAFQPGEAVSQKIIGSLIASQTDAVIAVDPHLHRTHDLRVVFPGIDVRTMTAAGLVGEAIAKDVFASDSFLIGPDEESEPLIRTAAEAAKCDWIVGRKTRRGDRSVEVLLPDSLNLEGKQAIIFDDVISSGSTICQCAKLAVKKGAAAVKVYTTHALFNEQDAAAMSAVGVSEIISCDGVPHATNRIGLASLLAEAVSECL